MLKNEKRPGRPLLPLSNFVLSSLSLSLSGNCQKECMVQNVTTCRAIWFCHSFHLEGPKPLITQTICNILLNVILSKHTHAWFPAKHRLSLSVQGYNLLLLYAVFKNYPLKTCLEEQCTIHVVVRTEQGVYKRCDRKINLPIVSSVEGKAVPIQALRVPRG